MSWRVVHGSRAGVMCGLAVAAAALGAGCGDNDLPNVCGPGPVQILFRGAVWGEQLAVAGGRVYFTTYDEGSAGDDEHAVRTVSTACGASEALWQGAPHGLLGDGLVVRGGNVFWSEDSGADSPAQLFRVSTIGGERVAVDTLGEAGNPPLAADDDAIYAAYPTELVRIPASGGASSRLASGTAIDGIGGTGGSLYYTAGGSLFDARTGVLLGGVPGFRGGHFEVDGTAAYFPVEGGILTVPLDGTPSSLRSTDQPRALVATADAFYAALFRPGAEGAADTDRIVRLPRDGGPATVLVDDLHYVFALALDGDALYAAQCACSDPGEILRIAL